MSLYRTVRLKLDELITQRYLTDEAQQAFADRDRFTVDGPGPG